MTLTTAFQRIISINVWPVTFIFNKRINKVFITKPFIINEIIGTQRKSRMIEPSDFCRKPHIIENGHFTITTSRRSDFGHQIISTITGAVLFTIHFNPIIPNKAIRDEEKESIKKHVVHDRINQSRHTSKSSQMEIKSITRESLINKERHQIARIERSLIAVGTIKRRTRNISLRNICEAVRHYRAHRRTFQKKQ